MRSCHWVACSRASTRSRRHYPCEQRPTADSNDCTGEGIKQVVMTPYCNRERCARAVHALR